MQFKGDSSMKGFLSTASRTSVFFVAFAGILTATGNTFTQIGSTSSLAASEQSWQQLEVTFTEQNVLPPPTDKGEPNPRNVRSSSLS